MRTVTALEGGLAGACALTAVHEWVRKAVPSAPRMDLLGKTALVKVLQGFGKNPPNERRLYTITMAGDIVSNALYYSLAGMSKRKNVLQNSTILGLLAGMGAVVLPKPLGLNPAFSNRTLSTRLMTIAWYTIAGIVAALVMKRLDKRIAAE